MRVGANLNAKGWTMISEGLEMLEVATAGAQCSKSVGAI